MNMKPNSVLRSREIEAKSRIEEDQGNDKNHVFMKCENVRIYRKVIKNEGSVRCVREREIHRKHIRIDTIIHPQIDGKSMQRPCSKK